MAAPSQMNACLRTLESELGLTALQSAAGYHDLQHIKIFGGHEGSAIVVFHEKIHDQMLRGTPFGAVIFALAGIHKSTADSRVATAAKKWLHETVRLSRFSQEAAATYLSIKTFPLHSQESILEGHPELYKRYYRGLSHCVDNVFGASYVQYLVAKTITQAVFGSRLIERLYEWSPDLPELITDEEAPDNRMAALLPVLSANFHDLKSILSERLHESATQLLDAHTLDSEEAWTCTAVEERERLEARLMRSIGDWLFPLADETIGVLHGDWKAMWHDFTSTLIRRYVPEDRSTLRDLAEAARVSILTGSTFDEGVWPEVGDIDTLSLFTETPAKAFEVRNPDGSEALAGEQFKTIISVNSTSTGHRNSVWWRLRSSGSGPSHADKFSKALLLRALTARSRLAALGWPIPTIDAIVVGIDSGDLAAAQSLITEIVDCFRLADDGGLFETHELVWYLLGDEIIWYNAIVSAGETEVFWFFPDTPAYRPPYALVPQMGGGLWFVVVRKSVPGIFYRAFAVFAATSLLELVQRDILAGTIRQMTHEEGNRIVPRVIAANRSMRLVWPEI